VVESGPGGENADTLADWIERILGTGLIGSIIVRIINHYLDYINMVAQTAVNLTISPGSSRTWYTAWNVFWIPPGKFQAWIYWGRYSDVRAIH
jgi:hypothetical protein